MLAGRQHFVSVGNRLKGATPEGTTPPGGYITERSRKRIVLFAEPYYDPEVGRFINCDNVHYIGTTQTGLSYNAFAYCENEPLNGVDLFGTTSIRFRSGYTLDEYTKEFYGGDEYSYVNASSTLKNKFMGKAWLAAAKLIRNKHPDGYSFYMHYREGKGKPYIYDYDKAIREDSAIMEYENNLIVDFMKFVQKRN